jgi:hypothetical protein
MNASSAHSLSAFGGALVLAAALALAGCASTTPAPAAGGSTAVASTPAAAAGSGSDSTKQPDGFPSDKVPLISGTILHAAHAGNIWGVWIASTDLAGDMAKATKLLVDAGYDNVIAGTSYSDFHGTEYQVHVTAKVDKTYGSSLAYAFYHVQ